MEKWWLQIKWTAFWMAIIFILCFGFFIIAKPILQGLILENYKQRIAGKLPDKLFWADSLYMKTYGLDYKFANKLFNN